MTDPMQFVAQTKHEWRSPASYKIQPLECWPKMKELRRNHARKIWNAKKDGKLALLGLLPMCSCLPVGLGKVQTFALGPHFGRIMDDPKLAVRCLEACEQRELGSDTCAVMRIQLGSIYLGFHNLSRTGERIPLEFCLEASLCPEMSKMARDMSREYGIPSYVIELSATSDSAGQEYLAAQLDEAIRWMERVTKLKYDDEKLIEATYTEWRSRVLWARIMELQKNRPAPLDQRMIASINTTVEVTHAYEPEMAALLQELLDEVKDRVANNISALGVERARILHQGQYPVFSYDHWPPGVILRLGVPYGAIMIGSRIMFAAWGAWEVLENGSWRAAPTLEEMGVTLRNRDDALRALARLYTEFFPAGQENRHDLRTKHELAMAKDWQADGVMFNLNSTCHFNTAAMMEGIQALQRAGIPTMTYEASYCDPREFNQQIVMNQLEAFMEHLGLSKIKA